MDRIKAFDTLFVNPSDKDGLSKAAKLLSDGNVVAFPTETVYGLGADATNSDAVKKIFEAKGRPSDNPLIVHISDKSQINELVEEITPVAKKLIDNFMPGPITVIMRKSSKIPSEVSAGLNTVGIRMPSHKVALEFLSLCGCPVAAPSANLSGSPSPTTAMHVKNDMDGYVAAIVDGGDSNVGLESTVVDATGDIPVILRPGAITSEMIDEALSTTTAYAGALEAGSIPPAPGMKYRHYAPGCPVEIITLPNTLEGVDYTDEKLSEEQKDEVFKLFAPFVLRAKEILDSNPAARIGIFGGHEISYFVEKLDDERFSSHINFYIYGDLCDVSSASHCLFDGLRHLDRQEVDVILAPGFKGEGLEVAYMNRLSKAAGNIVDDVPSRAYDEINDNTVDIPLEYFDDVFTSSVLFVSENDTNLSAICEGVLTKLFAKKGPFCSSENRKIGAELYVESCGLYASDGLSPDSMAVEAFSDVVGGTIAHHLSRRADVSIYDMNDLILTAHDKQAFEILNSYPELDGRVFSLSSYMASKGLVIKGDDGRVASVSIPDPTGENKETYIHTTKAIKAWLQILFPYIIKDLGAERFS
ncbi:MAG: threonylcarbamoyl-AMP synthase [Saccharofermentans sp.]|nr:threonylcarbamoyl-AMP synthase [Saccharofermentans sp.]